MVNRDAQPEQGHGKGAIVPETEEVKKIRKPRRTKQAASPSYGNGSLTAEEIGRRAYEIYLERGGEPGHELEDWLQAEQELREQAAKSRPQ